eukprot:TRINITY_DN7663_c0_g1_i1.p3 TRINITY_DN7663_c0_g1~~TRINITY_DN7663_c0_g1_i1.p3  ORF type:complete len:53 (+),score=8.10 TRINITY_DN7663_c0_g1_i1:223-381(+)
MASITFTYYSLRFSFRSSFSTFFFFFFFFFLDPYVLCVDTGRSSETAKAHRG